MDEEHYIELNELLKNYSIRKLFFDMLHHCGAFSQQYQADPHLTNFLMGRRNVGLWLMSEIEKAGEDWILIMTREARERKERKEIKDGRESDSGD